MSLFCNKACKKKKKSATFTIQNCAEQVHLTGQILCANFKHYIYSFYSPLEDFFFYYHIKICINIYINKNDYIL